MAFVHLSPPDENGFCSFSIETGLTKTGAEAARCIVAQVNPQMPYIYGDTLIHVKDLDYIVEVDAPLDEYNKGADPSDPVIEQIARRVAELIPDGATLQMGIGALPDSVLPYLEDRTDLGIHTELFSEGVVHLVKRGVITGARKTLHPGKIIAGFILGSREMYPWLDHNELVELHPTDYVNDPCVIGQNYRQVAINGAIEVDLTGQVCADSIGPKFYSGVGGQMDFIYGASRSEGCADHCVAKHSQERLNESDRADAQAGRGCGHLPQPRTLDRDGIRSGRSLREEHPPTDRSSDLHRPSQVPRGIDRAGQRPRLYLNCPHPRSEVQAGVPAAWRWSSK